MFFLEAHVQVQALDSSLYFKQPLRADDLEQTNCLKTSSQRAAIAANRKKGT